MVSMAALVGMATVCTAQGLPPVPTAPSLPPLPATQPPGPSQRQPDLQPALAGDGAPDCSAATVEDRVFDYSARMIRDTYGRNVYGKLMRVAQMEGTGSKRTCSGELSDSDGWTYDIRFVVDRTATDLVDIGFDFSHVKPPPHATVPALAPAPDQARRP